METRFDKLKNEILKRVKESKVCKIKYEPAHKAENFDQLMRVVKDDFDWSCREKVLTSDLIDEYEKEFADADIYCNRDCDNGFLLVDKGDFKSRGHNIAVVMGNTKVEAYDSCRVYAFENAKVEVYGNAKVTAWDDSEVEACGNAKVEAYGSCRVYAYNNAKVTACGNAKVTAFNNARVNAYDNAKVEAWDICRVIAYNNAKVEARGYSYILSYEPIDCKLHDNAMHHIINTKTIRYAAEGMKFEKVQEGEDDKAIKK